MGFMSRMVDTVYNDKPKKENWVWPHYDTIKRVDISLKDNVQIYAGYLNLLKACVSVDFHLGKYKSLADILNKLKIKVVIEQGIAYQEMPSGLEEAEKYWRDEVNRLRDQRYKEDDDFNEGRLREALSNLEDILSAKYNLSESRTPLRGCYIPKEKVIKLYPEEMETEYKGECMAELLVSTLAHETMHAYFDRPRLRSSYPYVYFVEEPLAEFGMLLYLDETKCKFYDWAYKDVSDKHSCYRYGAWLMKQHLAEAQNSGASSLRQYLVNFKIRLKNYEMPQVDRAGEIITMPQAGDDPVNIGGNIISPKWEDVFQFPPRYFYDKATQTLGLDGDWRERRRHSKLDNDIYVIYYYFDIIIHTCSTVKQVYLGDHFTIDSYHCFDGIFSEYEVIVSPVNRCVTAINGIPIFKKDGTPALSECGKGFYKICRNGKWGVIDKNLTEIVPIKYDSVWSFDKNELLEVEIDGHHGLVNKRWKEQVPVIYDHITKNDDGTYTVKKGGEEYVIDEYGIRQE